MASTSFLDNMPADMPCTQCATVMFNEHFGRACTKEDGSGKCHHCIPTEIECVPIPEHLRLNLAVMIDLLHRHNETEDDNERTQLRNTLECFSRDLNRMLCEHDAISRARARVIVGADGVARVEHELHPGPNVEGNLTTNSSEGGNVSGNRPTFTNADVNEESETDLLRRAVAAMEAQTHATIVLRNQLNNIVDLMREIVDSCSQASRSNAPGPNGHMTTSVSMRPIPRDAELLPRRRSQANANVNGHVNADINGHPPHPLHLRDPAECPWMTWRDESPSERQRRRRDEDIRIMNSRAEGAQMRRTAELRARDATVRLMREAQNGQNHE